MDEIIKIDKINPHPTEAIVLYYNNKEMCLGDVYAIYELVQDRFPENKVIALPDQMSIDSCSKDVLENIISMLSEIIDEL